MSESQEPGGTEPGGTEPGRRRVVTMEEVREAAAAVRARSDLEPRAAVILGTGLDGLVEDLETEEEVPYAEIPGFPRPTMEGLHRGVLHMARLDGVPVAAMQGRFHGYEGHSLQAATFPVRVLRELGAEILLVSGACGGMHPLWELGDVVLLADHINLMGDNPLVGPNVEEQGPRFPDMSEAYDAELRELARETALEMGLTLREGVYVAVPGPSLETPAEYRMLRQLGADVVGMSTVPEVIVARHAGLRVLGLSVITDMCLPDALEPVEVEKILEVAAAAEPDLREMVRRVLGRA